MPLIRKTPAPASLPAQDVAAVLAALVNGSDDERWAAARGAVALPNGAKALGAALARETDPRVREAMFTGLARIATPESVEEILPLVRSDDARLRTGALDALRAMNEVVWPYLPQLLHDADADVRLLACELVRKLPAEDATRLLCDVLDAELTANVCASAIEVLAELGGPEALPALDRCRARFAGNAFLEFSVKITADRIRSQAAQRRG